VDLIEALGDALAAPDHPELGGGRYRCCHSRSPLSFDRSQAATLGTVQRHCPMAGRHIAPRTDRGEWHGVGNTNTGNLTTRLSW
jgi:hypothetical protein